MSLALIHRRLAVFMGLASLLAFAGGAGVEPLPAILAASGLLLSLFWQPFTKLSVRLEKLWLPLAMLLVLRAIWHVAVVHDDLVIPVVDLLFLLLVAEALRSLDAPNDSRLYSLSFALLLAATAYRPGLLFALAFIAYIGLATIALMVGHLRRQGERYGAEEVSVPPTFLATTAALSAATLLFSALVFLTFPRVSQGWAGRGQPLATSIAGFSDRVSLGSHGARIFGNPQIVLRVEFPDGTPENLQSLYWRGRSYDRFDGVQWRRSSRLPPSLAPAEWYERWGPEMTTQSIYGSRLDSRVLFALHPLVDVDSDSRIQPIFDNAGDFLYWGSGTPAYTAYSRSGRPSPEELREAQGRFVPARQYYLRLPEVSPEVRSLADSLMEGLASDYDKVVALQRWFQEEFTYTLELPGSAREATLEHFLLQRRAGHCEYFSTSMAILLRTHGIPTREVNGFLGGEWSEFGNYLAVTQNQAHAWVEVWFPDYGWVPFDPTPAGTGDGTALNSWLWPGRFLFDAIQHRWNKWVLDYSLQIQFGLFQRGRELLSQSPESQEGPNGNTGTGLPGGSLWWILGALGLGATLITRRGRGPIPRETRLFLRLRESSRRAGVPTAALHSPLSLTNYLEAVRHPGAPSARAVVDGYLHARFSGEDPGENSVEFMTQALKRAREFLRRQPINRGSAPSRSRRHPSVSG